MFETISSTGHEQVVYCHLPEVGLKAIIGIHSTRLGPALGGCRMWSYKSDQEALTDVLRLSRGMTYKAAISGLNLGGGKAVIIGDETKRTEAFFRAFGRFVQSLNGRYITAEDVGTSVQCMDWVKQETDHVTGVKKSEGGSGDPSPYTARGVFNGILAASEAAFGSAELKGKVVALQGCGHVGYHLAKFLSKAGCKLIISDIREEKVKQLIDECGAEAVDSKEIHKVKCDIFAPCALGAVVNPESIGQLKCKVIAGAANNQLATDDMGQVLKSMGILYAPDYVINAGGLMNVSFELEGYNETKAVKMIDGIRDTLSEIFKVAKNENIATSVAADRIAEKRLAASTTKLPRL